MPGRILLQRRVERLEFRIPVVYALQQGTTFAGSEQGEYPDSTYAWMANGMINSATSGGSFSQTLVRILPSIVSRLRRLLRLLLQRGVLPP
jgi:hypothetical protein